MRSILIAVTTACLALAGCTEDLGRTTTDLEGEPTEPTSNACADEVKAEAIAAAEAGEAYDYPGQLAARCDVIIEQGPETAPSEPDGDPATVACANEVKAEALAAAEAGEPYDYPGQLATRCGVFLSGTDAPSS